MRGVAAAEEEGELKESDLPVPSGAGAAARATRAARAHGPRDGESAACEEGNASCPFFLFDAPFFLPFFLSLDAVALFNDPARLSAFFSARVIWSCQGLSLADTDRI